MEGARKMIFFVLVQIRTDLLKRIPEGWRDGSAWKSLAALPEDEVQFPAST